MKTNTRSLIHSFISKNSGISAHKIHENFGISKEMTHRHLKKLILENKIYKEGSPPKVLYFSKGGLEIRHETSKGHMFFSLIKNGKVLTITNKGIKKDIVKKSDFEKIFLETTKYIDDKYISASIKVKPNGLYNVVSYFIVRSSEITSKSFEGYMEEQFPQMANDSNKRAYGVFLTMRQSQTKLPYLHASGKLASLKPDYTICKEKMCIDSLYYTGLDKIDKHKSVYYKTMESIKEFQEEAEIESFFERIFDSRFEKLLSGLSIDAIAVIPNSVGRKISFNEYIEKKLSNSYCAIPFFEIATNSFPGRRPQKKINGICNRIVNAEKLFDVETLSSKNGIQQILIIDDVLGSGATMNTIAKKIKVHYPDAKIHGYSILGSYRKGFDVISGI